MSIVMGYGFYKAGKGIREQKYGLNPPPPPPPPQVSSENIAAASSLSLRSPFCHAPSIILVM
jgi:hypothetical protein